MIDTLPPYQSILRLAGKHGIKASLKEYGTLRVCVRRLTSDEQGLLSGAGIGRITKSKNNELMS